MQTSSDSSDRPCRSRPADCRGKNSSSADAEEGYRYEMIEGRVFVSPVPDLPHDDLVEWLTKAARPRTPGSIPISSAASKGRQVFLRSEPRDDGPGAGHRLLLGIPESTSPRRDERLANVSPPSRGRNPLGGQPGQRPRTQSRLYLDVPSIREYWIVGPRSRTRTVPR